MIYSVCEHPGLTVLIGEAGTGKTTLLYVLRNWLDSQRFVNALCTNPVLTREELFDLLLQQFDVPCSSPLKNRQLVALQERLIQYRTEGRSAILLVDEAQRLPFDLLEELRLLLNVETPREKLLEIILIGQPELSDILRRPELRQLKQRVSCMCKLEPLILEEVREYIDHRLTQAGLPNQTLFPEETIPAIFQCTRGIPRLVNSLCDSALQTGFGLRSAQISSDIILEAARDLDLNSDDVPGHPTSNGKVHLAAAAGAESGASRHSYAVPSILEDYATRQKSLGFLSKLIAGR